MLRMSFSMTEEQYLDGSKDVTRRLGWWTDRRGRRRLLPGQKFMGVRKCMGLSKGERQVELGPSECLDVRRERVDAITPEDVVREGFPDMTVAEFVEMFCAANRCRPDTMITRIEFRRVNPGVCEECGGPADFEDADRVQCDCGATVCSACCEVHDGESYCHDCAIALSQGEGQ